MDTVDTLCSLCYYGYFRLNRFRNSGYSSHTSGNIQEEKEDVDEFEAEDVQLRCGIASSYYGGGI